jgi:hypothetical protein
MMRRHRLALLLALLSACEGSPGDAFHASRGGAVHSLSLYGGLRPTLRVAF